MKLCVKGGLIVLFILVAWAFQSHVAALILWIRTLGYTAAFLFCVLYCVTSLLFLPIMPIILAGGAIFGPCWGLVINMVSATLSATLAFMISRHLGLDWLSPSTKKRIDTWMSKIEPYGWKSLAACRLAPFIPCAVVNYGFGFTQIKTRAYLLTSLIFFIPLKILETYCGYLTLS